MIKENQYINKKGEVKTKVFSDETIKALTELGEVLRRIHNRLISEGYEIRGDVIIPPSKDTRNLCRLKQTAGNRHCQMLKTLIL